MTCGGWDILSDCCSKCAVSSGKRREWTILNLFQGPLQSTGGWSRINLTYHQLHIRNIKQWPIEAIEQTQPESYRRSEQGPIVKHLLTRIQRPETYLLTTRNRLLPQSSLSPADSHPNAALHRPSISRPILPVPIYRCEVYSKYMILLLRTTGHSY